MKILVTSIVDLKASQHNRPHQFVQYLAQHHDVTVLSIKDWWKREQTGLLGLRTEFSDFLDGIEYRYLTERKISPILQQVLFRRVENELMNDGFDVHLNYNSLIAGCETSKHVPTVFDLADDLAAMVGSSPQIPPPLRPFGYVVGSHYLRREIARAQHVTLTFDGLRSIYRVPLSKSSVIPNGVDFDFFSNNSDERAAPDSDSFVMGYVGVLREWVDFAPVFQALQSLDKRIKMLIVGKEGRFKQNVRLAKRYGVADRVTFTGQVPYAQVPRYIAGMDVCLIPFGSDDVSRSALPLKLFEYMACEKPVLSSDLVGVRQIAQDLVLYCSSAADYIRAITALYQDEGLRRRMGRGGRKMILKEYSWERIVRRLEGILAHVATPA